MELNNNIKKLRFEKNDLSQQKLAYLVDVTRQTINAIENGKFNPSILLALKIARVFEKNVEDVFYLN